MSSKYDSVKVQVIVQDDHYYFLSRFLLSKMLMFAKVPPTAAVQISLDLKRSLIVRGKTVIRQNEMEDELYSLMSLYGLSHSDTQLFPLIKHFFASPVSLIVLLAGGASCGKSTIAKQLGLILNCSTVLNAETLLGIVDTVFADHPAGAAPCALQRGGGDASAVNDDVHAWQSRCSRVRASVTGEIEKCIAEGRSLIVEGEALNLALYKQFFPIHFQNERKTIVLPLLLHHPLPCDVPPTDARVFPEKCENEIFLPSRALVERALVTTHTRLLRQHHIHVAPLCKKNVQCASLSEVNGACWTVPFSHPEQLSCIVGEVHDVVIQRILEVLQMSL